MYPLIYAAAQLNLNIPKDLSLMTFGEQDYELLGTPTTKMAVQWDEIGHVAVEMLLQKILIANTALPSRHVGLKLQFGGTCAPPAKGFASS
jgi:DNA-binding LacI/PurR family transcriptional regulator